MTEQPAKIPPTLRELDEESVAMAEDAPESNVGESNTEAALNEGPTVGSLPLSDSDATPSSSGKDTSPISKQAYDSLLAVLERSGVTVKNGIILTRAIDKIFAAWNSLIADCKFREMQFQAAALRVVDPKHEQCDSSVYFQAGEAFANMFDSVDCSLDSLSQIEKGVEDMRSRVNRALQHEVNENGKAEIIQQILVALIGLEREYGMPSVAAGVRLDVSETSKAPEELPEALKRGYEDSHRLLLLQIWGQTHISRAEKTRLYNSLVPGSDKRPAALAWEYRRMKRAGITIRGLEAKLDE